MRALPGAGQQLIEPRTVSVCETIGDPARGASRAAVEVADEQQSALGDNAIELRRAAEQVPTIDPVQHEVYDHEIERAGNRQLAIATPRAAVRLAISATR